MLPLLSGVALPSEGGGRSPYNEDSIMSFASCAAVQTSPYGFLLACRMLSEPISDGSVVSAVVHLAWLGSTEDAQYCEHSLIFLRER